MLARYHDEEWGVANHEDSVHFEFLVLESAQAGLSWRTILQRRDGYRRAFCGFDAAAVAAFGAADVERLVADKAIIRNRAKIESTIRNARVYLALQDEFGSFNTYIWRFVGGGPVVNRWSAFENLPAETAASQELSSDLRRRGMRFVGPIVCYAHMQATGLVMDHVTSCYRWEELAAGGPASPAPRDGVNARFHQAGRLTASRRTQTK